MRLSFGKNRTFLGKEALGYTPENSIKAILFGQNIQSGYWGLFKTSDLAGLSTAQLGQVAKSSGDAFTEEELAKINGKESLVPFLVGLNSGTSYTLLVSAFNGYFSKVYAVEQTTAGKEDPMQQKYKFDDVKGEVSKDDLFNTTWNYYAVDAFDEMMPPTANTSARSRSVRMLTILITSKSRDFRPTLLRIWIRKTTRSWQSTTDWSARCRPATSVCSRPIMSATCSPTKRIPRE